MWKSVCAPWWNALRCHAVCWLSYYVGSFLTCRNGPFPPPSGVGMAGTGEGKKEEADYKRLHSFPLIRVGQKRDSPSWYRTRTSWLVLRAACSAVTTSRSHCDCCLVLCRLQILGCWVWVFIVKMYLFHRDVKCTYKNKYQLSKIAFWKWVTTSQCMRVCVFFFFLKDVLQNM